MNKETYIRAILESIFSGYKDELIDIAVKRIMEYQATEVMVMGKPYPYISNGGEALNCDAKMEGAHVLPSAESEWNNHTVACLLAEMFGDDCACNCNGIDEWLPEKCELLDYCPNPAGVACWEQYLKHRKEKT